MVIMCGETNCIIPILKLKTVVTTRWNKLIKLVFNRSLNPQVFLTIC